MSDPKRPDEVSRVDLGDDLLAPSGKSTAPPELPPHEIYENARILWSEGLIDEAKRQLHRVLIRDSAHAGARRLLDQIHARELEQIFSIEAESSAPRSLSQTEIPRPPTWIEADETLRRLELDLFGGAHELEEGSAWAKYADRLDVDLKSLSPRERCDLGIGFLEMGLGLVALRQFEAARKRLSLESESREWISTVCLLAMTQIRLSRPAEALIELQSLLRDTERVVTEGRDLIDAWYWLGVALVALRRPEEARLAFDRIRNWDPDYRDVRRRIELLVGSR